MDTNHQPGQEHYDIINYAADPERFAEILAEHRNVDFENITTRVIQEHWKRLFDEFFEFFEGTGQGKPRGILNAYDEHRRMEWPQARARSYDEPMALPRPVHGWFRGLELYDDRCHDHVLVELLLEGLRTI